MTKNAKIALCAIVVVLIAILIAVASCSGCSNDKAKTTQGKDAQVTATDKTQVKEQAEEPKEEASSEGQEQKGASSSASSGGASPAGGGSDGGSTPSSSGGEPTPAQHEHTWATRTVSDGEVWVVDQAAWDEKVAIGDHYHCSCGMDWYDTDSYISHQDDALCSYSVVTDYDWIHHDEVGHYEQRSHSETYCTVCGAIA